ncbi:hypothetical protein XELAEV_18028102mg [Xenopus laevis]|uniref:Uncharacterized protein n=1 Tax=Xenopus laevis TaxID=8355 RepID=A0A974CZ21_XENLA|nr:hypothetical protein XELAEV_18028102mg [Xenopus laevis]
MLLILYREPNYKQEKEPLVSHRSPLILICCCQSLSKAALGMLQAHGVLVPQSLQSTFGRGKDKRGKARITPNLLFSETDQSIIPVYILRLVMSEFISSAMDLWLNSKFRHVRIVS